MLRAYRRLLLNDAEGVAVGVGEHRVVGVVRVVPVDAGGAEAEQPVDLRRLVVGVEVEMVALRRSRARRSEKTRRYTTKVLSKPDLAGISSRKEFLARRRRRNS